MIRVKFNQVEGFQETKPLELDFISSKGNVYIRKDIIQVPNKDENGNDLEEMHWSYKEALLTIEEYQEYLAEIENPMLSTIMQTLTDIQLRLDEMA